MQVTYGGVTFGYTLTQGIEQVPESDPSGTDQTLNCVTIRIQAVLAANVIPALSPPATNPADVMNRIREYLLQKRRPLLVMHENTVLINVSAPPDLKNGPEPIACNVVLVTPGSYLVTWACKVYLPACPNGGSPGYLSHRWRESVSIDDRMLTTKVRAGTLIVSSADGISPDDLRDLVTPGVDPGFRRSSHYELDESGLIYKYRFEDKEMDRPPPWPATKLRGRMVQSSAPPGAVTHGNLSLRAEAPKGVSHKELLNCVIRVATSRALATGLRPGSGGDRMGVGHSIVEVLDDDMTAIEFSLSWLMKTTKARENGTADQTVQAISDAVKAALALGLSAGILGSFGARPPVPNAEGRDTAAVPQWAGWVGMPLPGSDPKRSIAPPTRGTADRVALVAAALGDPCGQTASDLTGEIPENDPPTQTRDLVGTLSISSLSTYTPDDQEGLFEDDDDGVWDYYFLTTHNTYDLGNVTLPSTKDGEPAAEVQLFNEQLKVQVEWSCKKVGGVPTIPQHKSNDSNVVLVGRTVSPQQIDVAGDGVSFIYTISGVYRYEVLRPDDYDVTAPIPPFLKLAPASRESDLIATVTDPDIIFGDGGTSELHGDPGDVQP